MPVSWAKEHSLAAESLDSSPFFVFSALPILYGSFAILLFRRFAGFSRRSRLFMSGPKDDRTNRPPQRLRASLASVPWIGAQGAETLKRLGLTTVRDLVFYFPRDYEPNAQLALIADLREDLPVRVKARLVDIELRGFRSGKSVLGALFQDDAGARFRAVWFNMPFLRQQLVKDNTYLVTGKGRLKGQTWEFPHPRAALLEADVQPEEQQGLSPIYSLTEGLLQGRLRMWMRRMLKQTIEEIEEPFPEPFRQGKQLIGIHDAVRWIHFPLSEEHLAQARRRLVYQELLVLQTALALRKAMVARQPAIPLSSDARVDARIRRRIPFQLSADQDQAIAELRQDLAKGHPMQRLLQGDVGAGKTIVAAYCLLLAVANGCQGALMAPTEILARQQFQTMGNLLQKSKVQVGLLVGGQKQAERELTLADIATGRTQVVVGTQAVIQEKVRFQKLGLVVIDEQHRFGVRERAILKQNQFAPHYLVMTATPIPRTMMLAACGDLDVSVLKEKPRGVLPISTHLVEPESRGAWWNFVRKKLREGRQAYIVAPLVESSERVEANNVEDLFESLTQTELASFRVGLIHGQQSSQLNQNAMDAFRLGKLDAVVCTSVIEVGLDVPNAVTITIYNPERFGLSQLHQLRGRVGRGAHAGFCGCFVDPAQTGNRARMEAFAAHSSGFDLAEIDFKLRGPGEVLGAKQSGLPRLAIADLARDGETLVEARTDALQLLAQNQLDDPSWRVFHKLVLQRHGLGMMLGDVG